MKEKGLILVIDLTLCPFLVLPSELLVASIFLSILFHLHPYHAPIFGVATATTLTFGKVSSFVDVSDIQVHCAIDDFVTMIDKVHCKAIVKETAVVSTRHTRIDVCYLCQHLHTGLHPNLIDHLLLV